jgi:hypothetical protein
MKKLVGKPKSNHAKKSQMSHRKPMQRTIKTCRAPKRPSVKKTSSKPTDRSEKKSVVVATPPVAAVPKKSSPTMYFTAETEQAIVEYNQATGSADRNRIYTGKIQHAFEKIAENIYNTFNFPYNEVSPQSFQKEAVSHMVVNMAKYDPSKGKAFGYFSIVAKNWFILENNNNYKRFKKHTEIIDEPSQSPGEFVVQPEHEREDRDVREFINLMVVYWDNNLKSLFPKDRDYNIASAVVEIFRRCDRIDIFNKKALYLYIREIADCQTQHITKVVNRMLFSYHNIKNEYLDTGKITGNYFSTRSFSDVVDL